jgi:hypothetical protein
MAFRPFGMTPLNFMLSHYYPAEAYGVGKETGFPVAIASSTAIVVSETSIELFEWDRAFGCCDPHVGTGTPARPAGQSPAGFNPSQKLSSFARPPGRGVRIYPCDSRMTNTHIFHIVVDPLGSQ